MEETNDLHPIELVAHLVLSGSLDNLNENFESLHNSQIVLLTRLKKMEDKLIILQLIIDDNDVNIQQDLIHIKLIRKKLMATQNTLQDIDKRVTDMNQKLDI